MRLKIIIICLVLVKLAFLLISNTSLLWNSDENQNYSIAENYNKGFGYTLFDEKTNTYRKTAYYASFPVYVYIFLQKIGISKVAWAIIFQIISTVLYAISLFYFFRLTGFFIFNEVIRYLALTLYGLFPSVVYYIGALFLYENIGLPILVIVVYQLIAGLKDGFSFKKIILISLGITLSSLFRAQILFVYLFVLAIYAVLALKKYLNCKTKLLNEMTVILASILLIAATHIPILFKNHSMFGSFILSTQPGFEFLQGHNPIARGSWYHYWGEPTSEFYKWVRRELPNIDTLNEYEESMARGRLAMQWIKSHPLGEVKLILKKLAIYFLPQNYAGGLPGNRFYNPINLFVYFLFFAYLMKRLVKIGKIPILREEALVLAPIIGSIILNLIFFVGYRWRYYAEPFMIILALSISRKSLFNKS